MTTPAQTIRVVTLYPGLMNVYADRGNLIALRSRAEARGIGCEVSAVELGGALPDAADVILIGGGQDREQRRVAPDLQRHAEALRGWVEEDVAVLAVCGGFQLFGHWYRTAFGDELPGVGIFDVITVAPGPRLERCVGNIIERSDFHGIGDVVGFENHAGRTYLGPDAAPFAKVIRGWGNNGADGTEGVAHRRAIGTYLHGSVLPKNPRITDVLIAAALRHRYGDVGPLPSLEAPLAERAHRAAVEIALRRGRPVTNKVSSAVARAG